MADSVKQLRAALASGALGDLPDRLRAAMDKDLEDETWPAELAPLFREFCGLRQVAVIYRGHAWMAGDCGPIRERLVHLDPVDGGRR